MDGASDPRPVAVLGAGPAGLTAGYMLARTSEPVIVFEAGSQVGGLARTVERDGYRFDLGGHRFFTKSDEVQRLWHEILGSELLLRSRLSRIFWRGRFIDYPLRLADVVRKVGAVELAHCAISYAAALVGRRASTAETFEDWVCARFGRRLYRLFFKAYTEKVWGVPATEIRAEWAAQRIRTLSFWRVVRAAVLKDGGEVHSLIEQFHYPRLGPGQMWEAMAAEIVAAGGQVRLAAEVTSIELRDGRVWALHAGGLRVEVRHAISSLPLRDIVAIADPPPPAEVLAAAHGLRYRDFLTVALIVRGDDLFPDNWIYVHDDDVRVGRIQNFRAWSEAMVPDPSHTCVGMEYFCFEGEPLWNMADDELVALATAELEHIGLASGARVEAGHVVRVPKAYPIYDSHYAQRVRTVRTWLETISNLQQIGRNGLHRYNNSDHSMLTALRAVENVQHDAGHDLWTVNSDDGYHEERAAPQPYRRAPETPALQRQLRPADGVVGAPVEQPD
ncbi:MAG TPA: NAD(P)/FAD-dependent oxidoreductase [Solirubrobacteraceae bacterium]|jgi:protoporphyrinogen oxidase|nr:NAD(P)/FAD-dependent oxidoreductase [Solirubrobacteraceae bacterium]